MDTVQYCRETAFVWWAAVTFRDRVRLVSATMAFHLSNATRKNRKSVPKCYRVNLVGKPQDLWLRTIGGDIFVLYEVFGSDCYKPPPGLSLNTIVDLGANVGCATLYLSSIAPSAKFICVEPVPSNVEILRRNLASVRGVTVVQAAISGKSGVVAFDDQRPAWGGKISTSGQLDVEAMSIDDLFARYAPEGMIDLVKMDIEGAEADVFSGPMRWLDRVRCITAELHAGFSFEHFRDILSGRGFDVSNQMIPTAIRRGV